MSSPPALPSADLWRLVEASSEGVMVVDEGGRIVYLNPVCARSLGYAAQELIGRPLADVTFPEDQPAIAERTSTALRDGVSGPPVLGRFRRKDGSQGRAVGLHFRTALDGRPALLMMGRDTTDREHLEENRRRSERDFQSLVEGLPSLVAVHCAGRLLYINPAGVRMLGCSRTEELLGRSVLDLVPPEDRHLYEERIDSRIRGQDEVRSFGPTLVRGLRADGQVRTLEVVTLPTHFDGQLADLVVGHDETDRLAAEAELARTNTALQRAEAMSAVGRLVAAVAHEVRNPLFAITSTMDSLLRTLPEDPFSRQCAEVLRQEASRLTDLMRDLLEYGKPREPRFVVGPVEEVVEQAVAAVAPVARARGVALVHRAGCARFQARMDPGRLAQVFQNVLDNAIRHAPTGTEVAVSGQAARRPDGEWIEYRVRDRGPGFREEDLPRIFEPFFSRRYGGTGLGLCIVQQICEEHGGAAEVRNAPDGGAQITIKLPADREEAPPP